MRSSSAIFSTLAALLLTGCMTSYPLGMSEDEWERLSPQQQLDARERQAELDQRERERRAEAARIAAEEERRERERREQRLRNAQPGEIVQCVVNNAEGYYAGAWRTAEPVGFTVVRGYPEVIDIPEQDRATRRVQAEARFDGAQITLCRPNRNECTTLAATQNQLRCGAQRNIQLNRVVRGTLYCDTPNRITNKTRPGRKQGEDD